MQSFIKNAAGLTLWAYLLGVAAIFTLVAVFPAPAFAVDAK